MTTIAFWKPYGVLTRFTDDDGRPTLADWIDRRDVYPAGRLDRDSEGLLLLSSEPELRGRLTASRHPRVYLVQVEGTMDEDSLDRIRSGVVVRGRRTAPAAVRAIDEPTWLPPRDPPIRYRASIPDMWIELTLTEGRNRQVRRMTAAVGHPTLRLVRWAVGPVTLHGLAPGAWRTLSPGEVDELRQELR
ncbi:MAG TPA: pseudouridine synthase [Acidimicrobiia bacterium]|nr:pseudouridine synthase [Acidimicrobiia bacterium]